MHFCNYTFFLILEHCAQGQNQQQPQSGSVQACEDIDECQDNNGDCEQVEPN